MRIRYNYACVFALASVAARADQRVAPAERQRRADSYARTALTWLKRAADTRFFDDPTHRDQARRDPDLASLRETSEFRKLVPDHTP